MNGELGLESSALSLNHPNFPCPFCSKIFDEKAELVEHLDTCDGTEDLSSMILLLVMRKLRTISTTAFTLMIPPCPKIFKEKSEVIEPMEVQRYKHIGMSNVLFLSRHLYEYWKICETHHQSPLVQMQTLFVQFLMLCYALILTSSKLHPSQCIVNTSCEVC